MLNFYQDEKNTDNIKPSEMFFVEWFYGFWKFPSLENKKVCSLYLYESWGFFLLSVVMVW